MSEPTDDERVRDLPQVRMLRAVWRASSALRDLHKNPSERLGVSMTEIDFLAALGNTEGLRMSDLARAMITTPSNVTRVCAAMEKKGWSVRQRSPESDREVIAKLTPEGQKRFEEVFPELVAFTTSTLDRFLTREEQTTVANVLDRLLEKISELQ